MKLGNKIKKARKARGLNQTQLAGKLHISRGTMSRIENDKTSVSEDLLNDMHVVLFGDRSGPAYPEGTEKSDFTPGQGGSRTRLRSLITPAVTALTTVQCRDQIRRKIPAGYAGITGGKRIANRLSR